MYRINEYSGVPATFCSGIFVRKEKGRCKPKHMRGRDAKTFLFIDAQALEGKNPGEQRCFMLFNRNMEHTDLQRV
jgi:hypothetical protein